MIEPNLTTLSLTKQCRLIGLARSSWQYDPVGESAENLRLMNRIDREYTRHPFYGVRRIAAWLRKQGESVNLKRVRRLMRIMGLEAIYPRKRLSSPMENHKKYPYLLRDLSIDRPNQVWCADITYLPMRRGFLYLMAVMDWYSRYVLSWTLSDSLEGTFCVDALEQALRRGRPEIFNTDQGVQFTSAAFTDVLIDHGVTISMDGRGRCYDNIFIERLWRTVKYEEVYLKAYEGLEDTRESLDAYFRFYNRERPHMFFGYRTPVSVYGGKTGTSTAGAKARPVAGTPVTLRVPSVPATGNRERTTILYKP